MDHVPQISLIFTVSAGARWRVWVSRLAKTHSCRDLHGMTNNAAASDVAFFFQQVMRRDLMTVLSCDSKAREDRCSCLDLFWVSFQCCAL